MQQREEFEVLKSRIAVILGFVLLGFGILTFGFWSHQIAQSPHYQQLAERNRIRDIRLAAPRGRILDREHRVIADSRPSYDLTLTRENSVRAAEETIRLLAPGLELSEDALLERYARERATPAYQPIVLKEDLSVEEIAFVQARQYELPEVSLEFRPRRRYQEGELAAHLLGYVGQISAEQLASGRFPDRRSGDTVGQSGLERQYDPVLQGTDGVRRVIVNNFNREMGVLGEAPPEPGRDLVTTIDLDLQRAAEAALGDRTGVAVAIDPRTGEVLALASRPAFDPTLFAEGIPPEEWRRLTGDPRNPLQNRAIQNRYSPGSVFKIMMAAAGLAEGVVSTSESIFCPGHATHYGNSFACWRAGGHGHVTLHEALVHSCNVFFYEIGDRLGIDRIHQYATIMGLGRRTGIDLPNEDAGLIPSRDWKRSRFNAPWYPGETISVSIGQGAVSVTPLQLTWAVGGVAVGGRLVQPHLVDPRTVRALGFDAPHLRQEHYPVAPDALDALQGSLFDVVRVGTGARARVPGFDVAGKTGTAQVVGRAAIGARDEFQDHAWFVGFAPYDAPEIAVGVFVEHGGGGGAAAAPVAQAVLRTYFEKKLGEFTSNRLVDVASLND